MPELEHAKYSPSTLELFELCPCYTKAVSAGSAADDGTRLHKATETDDLSLCKDVEEEDAVKRCTAYRDEVKASRGKDCKYYPELKLQVGTLTEGTGDVVLVDTPHADLIDWKFGRQPVTEAMDNVQMQGYAVGVFTKFPKVKEVTVHIVGPRMDFLSIATYKDTDVRRITARIQAIIDRCESEDKKPTPSEKACRWCSAKALCPALGGVALSVIKGSGLPMPQEFAPGQMLRPEDRAAAQVLSYILEDWAKQVREYNVKAVIEDGITIPGFSLRTRKGSTTVVDSFVALKAIIESHDDITLDELLQACSVSIPQVADQLYAKSQIAGKKETKKSIREKLMVTIKDVVSEPDTITFLQRNTNKE